MEPQLTPPTAVVQRTMSYKRILEQVVPQPFLETNNGAFVRETY